MKKTDISVVQLGVGGVGAELVRQLMAQQEHFYTRYGLRLHYHALVERDGIIATGAPLDMATVSAATNARTTGTPFADCIGGNPPGDWQQYMPNTPSILVDVTAADGFGEHMVAAVAQQHRLVFANKRILSGSLDVFHTLTEHGATRYEATVGAGLPVIDTLQRLLDSGDSIIRIEAAMSGTLGYLCSALEDGVAFSEAVRIAKHNGWTEPDPRDDLSGADVARKALILARTCGFAWNIADVPSEAWFPPAFAELSLDNTLQRLSELDVTYAERVAAATANNMVLRYVATIEPTGARVGLRELPLTHPLATLRGTDNMVVFETQRYSDPMPTMVIRGPGAGIGVTAAGVLGDIIATARELQ